jgi:hypothetical protein
MASNLVLSVEPVELYPQSALCAEHKIVGVHLDWDWCALCWAQYKVGQYSRSSRLHLHRSEPETCHQHQQ